MVVVQLVLLLPVCYLFHLSAISLHETIIESLGHLWRRKRQLEAGIGQWIVTQNCSWYWTASYTNTFLSLCLSTCNSRLTLATVYWVHMHSHWQTCRTPYDPRTCTQNVSKVNVEWSSSLAFLLEPLQTLEQNSGIFYINKRICSNVHSLQNLLKDKMLEWGNYRVWRIWRSASSC